MVSLTSFFSRSSQKTPSSSRQASRQSSRRNSREGSQLDLDEGVNSCSSSIESTSTKLYRLNTASLREYGECYKRLGKGSTAIISICKSKRLSYDSTSECKLYAIKQFRKRNKTETEKEYMKKLTSEFCISSTFHHQNVIETIDLVLDNQTRYCTVMEYCQGGDLFSAIMSGHMTEIEMACCFKQMMKGIAYLHSVGVAHRDIKPENLLLTLDGTLKITDFGVSDVFRCAWEKKCHKCHGLVGSEPYIAPEAFDRKDYWGSLSDIWSAGIVLYSMYKSGHAWIRADKKSDREFRSYLDHHPARTYPNFKKFNDSMRDLIYKMLEPNPEHRLTAEQVLEHKWVKSILLCEKGIDTMNRHHKHTTATK